MNSSARDLGRWLPSAVWMVVIFVASTDIGSSAHTGSLLEPLLRWLFRGHVSTETINEVHFVIRKTAHLTEYAVLGALLWTAFARNGWRGAGTAAIIAAACYATSDEWHQSFVPTRTPAIRDVLIDTIGSILGVIAWSALTRHRRQPPKRQDLPLPDRS